MRYFYRDIRRIVPNSELGRLDEALVRLDAVLKHRSQRIQGISYITGRRRAFVFEVRTTSGNSGHSYFLKFGVRLSQEIIDYVTRESSNTYRVHAAITGSDLFRVVEPVAFYDDLACLVLHGSQGDRLDKLILEAASRSGGSVAIDDARLYCELAARWLTYFQNRVHLDRTKPRTSLDALLARAERELVILSMSASGQVSETQCKLIRDTMIALLGRFAPDDFVASARHNDFAPWNVLCNEGSICVIDFADLSDGCRYFDAYQFVDAMHTLSNKILTNKKLILELKSMFIRASDVIGAASPAASEYFRLLHKLIRINAVLNNARTGFPYSLRNSHLLKKYLREIMENCKNARFNHLID